MPPVNVDFFLNDQDSSFENCRKEISTQYLTKGSETETVEETLLIYEEKNGDIYEYNNLNLLDGIFNTNFKLCLYKGEIDDKRIPHGHGKLFFGDKSISGKFYHGLPMDSSAILETKNYISIANILGYEIIKIEHIRYKKK